MSTRQSLSGVAVKGRVTADATPAGGVYEGPSKVYSDYDPAETIMIATTGVDPAMPPSGAAVIYANTEGRIFTENSSGLVREITSAESVFAASTGQMVKLGGKTEIATDGIAAPIVAGTVASADDATGRWLSLTTGAVLSGAAGYYPQGTSTTTAGFLMTRQSWKSELIQIVRTGTAITSLRFWMGWCSASVDGSATPAVHLNAFRYDTAADGTAFWRCVSAAGTTTQTVTVTTVPVVASTTYRFRIQQETGKTVFLINDVIVATHTTNLPTATMGYCVRMVNLAVAARTILWARMGLVEYV